MKTITIAGAGPAGLSAAIHLHCSGYPVDVFERRPDVGARFIGETDRSFVLPGRGEDDHRVSLRTLLWCLHAQGRTGHGGAGRRRDAPSETAWLFPGRRGASGTGSSVESADA